MTDTRSQLQRESARIADRLRALSAVRLSRRGPEGSPADQVHATGQRLADLAADSARRERHTVPRLGDHAAADQLSVLAADVLLEGDDDALTAALDALVALRRSL